MTAQQLNNPYNCVGEVRDLNRFFGRKHELKLLYSAIENQRSISIVGPRHIGKSSLLRCIQSPEVQSRSEYDLSRSILVFIDLQADPQKTPHDFFRAVGEQVAMQSRGRVDLVFRSTGGEDDFSNIIDQTNEQGFHLVLLMDTFDKITRNSHFDLNFFSFLRSQAVRVSYVTASIAPLDKVCHRAIKDSPFFNIFSTHHIELLTHEEAYELVTVPAQRINLPFTQDEVEWALSLAGRHPFFIQRTCYWLLESKQKHEGKENARVQVKRQTYHDLKPFFELVWKSLSSEQRKQLKEAIQQAATNPQKRELGFSGVGESFLFRMFLCQKLNIATTETFSAVEDLLRCLPSVEPLSGPLNQLFYRQKSLDKYQNRPNYEADFIHCRVDSRSDVNATIANDDELDW